jgi:cytochrome c-type biogenesis protein CcmE
MQAMKTKLMIGGGIVLAAVLFLAYAGSGDSWVKYLSVDEYTAEPANRPLRVRLHGTVAEEGLEADAGLMQANFSIQGDSTAVPVTFSGIVPDMFQAGAEVVVEGKLDENGVFQADTLLTKCASKYESNADTPAQPANHPQPAGDA